MLGGNIKSDLFREREFYKIVKKRLDFSDYFYKLWGFLCFTIINATIAQ